MRNAEVEQNIVICRRRGGQLSIILLQSLLNDLLTRNSMLFLQPFESSANPAVIVYKVESNAHARSVICSSAMFLTNAHTKYYS